ncbi:MAG: tail sheath protein [Rhodospirillaceae bacterium]|nr:MAG: tail sheath protein [Rhodospirillaceae bacterium]
MIDLIRNDPSICYHPRLAAAFVPVSIEAPDELAAGWRVGADGRCTPPPPEPEPPPSASALLPKLAFLRRFTQEERIAIRAQGKTDPVIKDFWLLLDLADTVDVTDPGMVQTIRYLEHPGRRAGFDPAGGGAMSETFLHGVRVIEIDDGPRPIRSVETGVIGLIGTAPDADVTVFPLDTPVLVAGSRLKAAQLGAEGTLP